MRELVSNVVKWASDRNLIEGSNPASQFLKLTEELQEVINSKTEDELTKEIGDFHVVSIIIQAQLGFTDFTNLRATYSSCEWIDLMGNIATDLAKGRCAKNSIGAACNCINDFLPEGVTPYDAILVAYKKIEHRKGKMINNVFVKEADL